MANKAEVADHLLTTLGERFWSKVAKAAADQCWNWTAATGSGGYGAYKMCPGKTGQAHRLALIESVGGDRPGLQARHSCDNPLCCNPAHLSWGTHQQNQDDKRRGRVSASLARGATAHMAAQFVLGRFA